MNTKLHTSGIIAWMLCVALVVCVCVFGLNRHPSDLDDEFLDLQDCYPLPHPVELLREPCEDADDWGEASFDDATQTFVITIDSSCPRAEEALAHEYAHCLAWDAFEAHGVDWGVAYSKCYQTVFGDVE